jgi:lysyl endopeptidase
MRVLLAALLASAIPVASAFTPDLARLDALPLHAVPAQAVTKLLAAGKASPLQFAVGVPLALSLADGVWDSPEANVARWRTRVFSAGAQSLNFQFAKVHLPEGAALWIYDGEAQLVQGPLTARDIAPDGNLWTPVILGETAVLELRVPASSRGHVRLALAQVNHGYRFFAKADGGFKAAGACEVDVKCPLGDGWRNEIRAVARYTISGALGSVLCTGELLNRVTQDNAPLFLTADHCGVGTINGSAASTVFYWNYERPSCGGGSGTLANNQNGATELADDANSDFSLLRLNAMPDPAYHVFLSGWNASGTLSPSAGRSIHHPQGSEKSISEFGGGTVRTMQAIESGGSPKQVWRVDHWLQGTTEQGSSGGGLWNQDHQVIGVLSGGEAACDGNVDNDLPDYFGRLDAGWAPTGSGSSDQLKAHLDPQNSGRCAMSGRNPGDAPLTSFPQSVGCPNGSATGGTTGGTTGTDDGGGGGGGAMPLAALALLALLVGLRRRVAHAAPDQRR